MLDLLEAGILLSLNEAARFEASSIAVKASKDLTGHLWALNCLGLAPSLVDIGSKRVLEVLGRAASGLELL